MFVGGPGTSACHLFDGDQAGCEQAYHADWNFNASSCWYDTGSDTCMGCGLSNSDQCTNTCREGPAACTLDASRTTFAGGPGTGACFELADEASCLQAFHIGQCGRASCYWTGSNCQGCGFINEQSIECFNTCTVP
jgi:hypothetical protein